ncbi:MAG: hypothetical protein ACFFBD_28465, partial [Candidatus Hodarchaeota archaeon]
YSTSSVFSFVSRDLQLLNELLLSGERQIKYIPLRAQFKSEGQAYGRLKQLRDAEVFQTYFQLYNAGHNERYYLVVSGSEPVLKIIYQFVCHFPQYYITKAEKCIFALVWLPPKGVPSFLKACTQLKEKLHLQEFYYGIIDQKARAHRPNLVTLCKIKGEKKVWYSEPEWE